MRGEKFIKDYIDEIDFSIQLQKTNMIISWEKIITRFKKKKNSYDEKEYAFGIYQVLPLPPESKKTLKDRMTTLESI